MLTRPGFVALAALSFAVLLHYVYLEQIAPSFAYAGYRYREPSWDLYAYALGSCVVVALALPRTLTKPSDLVLWVLYVVAVAPSILVPQYADVIPPGDATVLGLGIAASFFVVCLGCKGKRSRLVPRIDMPSGVFWGIIAVMTLGVYGYMLATTGLHLRVVSLADVYDVRADYKQQLLGAGLLGYVIPIQANVINPIFLARGVYAKRWSLIAVGLLGQILIYSSTGFKTVLFSTPFLIGASFLFRYNSRPSGAVVLVGAMSVVAGSSLLDKLYATNVWTSLFVRRLLITPGLLSAVYVYVFQLLPKAHFGHSFLAGFTDYPFLRSPARIVGDIYFDSPTASVNANLFADGFMNLGYLGLFGESLVLLLALRVIDSASRGVPLAVSGLVLLMPTISLANSSVFVTLLTHGLATAAVLLACAPRTGWGRAQTSAAGR